MDTKRCSIHEIYEAEKRDKRAKCVRAKGNGTLYLMNGLNEVMQLLTPSSGGTKSENPGNCVVILFYTKFCPGCQALVPHWNSLARNFVDIKVSNLIGRCNTYNYSETRFKLLCNIINFSLLGRSLGRLRVSWIKHGFWNHWSTINCPVPSRQNDSKV